jgi:hypothetical protein
LNRPIDFCNSDERTNPIPAWSWKAGVTDQQIYDALVKDELIGGGGFKDALKDFRKCPVSLWSRAVPFYTDKNCKSGRWE